MARGFGLAFAFVVGCHTPAPQASGSGEQATPAHSRPTAAASATPPRDGESPRPRSLRLAFVDDFNIPPGTEVDGSTLGGISGMAVSDGGRTLWALSDGRRKNGPLRLYRFALSIAGGELALADGQTVRLDPKGHFDPDRFDPEGLVRMTDGTFVVASEGDARGGPPVVGAQIEIFDADGAHRESVAMPDALVPRGETHGIRYNHGPEALAMSGRGQLIAGFEQALYQDGPRPTTTHGVDVRFFRWADWWAEPEQFRYRIDPLPRMGEPLVHGAGVTEVVVLDEDDWLVLERALTKIDGRFKFRIRLYRSRPAAGRLSKELVLDFDTVIPELDSAYPQLDNFEALALFTQAGERWLLVASDDNFLPEQRTAFLLFRIVESG